MKTSQLHIAIADNLLTQADLALARDDMRHAEVLAIVAAAHTGQAGVLVAEGMRQDVADARPRRPNAGWGPG